jgi:hypothetical protein
VLATRTSWKKTAPLGWQPLPEIPDCPRRTPMHDPYTMEVRLCDDTGLVSNERVEPDSPGTAFDPDLTYLKLLNNLRAHNANLDARKPYDGEPFVCTGSAHLAGQHIRCTSPAHTRLRMADALGTGLDARHMRTIEMRAALAGYDAQYGHGGPTLAEQHLELPRGCVDRIEAVVRVLRDELAEVDRVG